MSGLRDFLNRVLEWLNGETTPAPTPTPMPRQGPAGSSTVSKPLPIQPEPPQVVITVGHGDTLFSLADKYNVSVQAIMRANRLPAPNKIYIGQKLAIPQPVVTAPPASHAPDRQQVYRVRGNDTLASIAKKFNLPPEVIMVDNDLRGPTSLVPGQWLIIAGPDEGLTQSTTNRTATRRTDTDEPVDLPDWLRQPLERPKPRPRPKPEIVPRQQHDLGLDVPEVKTPPAKPPQDSLPRRPTPTRPSKPVEAKTDSKPAPSTPTRADSKSTPKPPVQPVPSRSKPTQPRTEGQPPSKPKSQPPKPPVSDAPPPKPVPPKPEKQPESQQPPAPSKPGSVTTSPGPKPVQPAADRPKVEKSPAPAKPEKSVESGPSGGQVPRTPVSKPEPVTKQPGPKPAQPAADRPKVEKSPAPAKPEKPVEPASSTRQAIPPVAKTEPESQPPPDVAQPTEQRPSTDQVATPEVSEPKPAQPEPAPPTSLAQPKKETEPDPSVKTPIWLPTDVSDLPIKPQPEPSITEPPVEEAIELLEEELIGPVEAFESQVQNDDLPFEAQYDPDMEAADAPPTKVTEPPLRPRLVTPSTTVEQPDKPPPKPVKQPEPEMPAAAEPRPKPRLVIVPPGETKLPKTKPASVEELPVLAMPPDAVQAVYIAYHTLGNAADRERILNLIQNSSLNTVVIDIKGDGGYLGYPSQRYRAVQIEAARPIVRDLVQVLDWFKANQVRTIARYVTFKDNLLARAEPGWAARHPHTGAIWWDAQNMAWLNPAEPAVWDYHLPLIEEVAQLGFDEILFDALHFPAPDVRGQPQFDQPLTAESRTSAIAGFLSAVRGILTPYPLKIGANVVGYACWRSDDALVGQQLERLAPYLDVIAPLLYPSRLANGIPGCLNPMRCPGDVVYQGTRQAVARLKTAAPGCQVRPWLQDFQDDVFDRRRFGVSEIQAQISGAVRGQAKGFMVWDPQLDYTRAAFQIGAL